MSPGFHPNFSFETLLQWTRSNHHKSCQSLSFWRNFSIVIQTSSCPASSQKDHLYPLMISTTFVQFQTSSSFPKFSRKSLLPAFNLTCLLTHCLLLFSLLTGSFHSTETILKIHNDLILAMDRGEVTSLILLNLSAAFDTVDHSILLTRLQNWFGLDGLSLDWFSSYLSLRSQAVSINDSISAFSTLSCGVPQGSVLFHSFSLSIQFLLARWSQKILLKYHLYADDTQLYISFTPTTSALSLESPPLALTFFLGWTWTNCFSIHQKLNFFSLAQNNSVSNFLI